MLLAGLPALAASLGAVSTAAHQPYYTEVQGRLPLFHLLRLLHDLPLGSLAALTGLAVVLALLGEQILVAGGLEWLERARGGRAEGRALRAVLTGGARWLLPMLRVVLLAASCAGAGLIAIRWVFDLLADHGELAGWTGRTQLLVLPAMRLLVSVLWLSFIGAWAFWCRVLMVADGRRTVRTAWLLSLRVIRRRPVRAPLFFITMTMAGQVGAGVVLVIWRQYPPLGGIGVASWGEYENSTSWRITRPIRVLMRVLTGKG